MCMRHEGKVSNRVRGIEGYNKCECAVQGNNGRSKVML